MIVHSQILLFYVTILLIVWFCYTGNGRVCFDFKCKNITGDPDGMTIDTNGNLWVACFNSDHVRFQKMISHFS